jgi:hypothetical protein
VSGASKQWRMLSTASSATSRRSERARARARNAIRIYEGADRGRRGARGQATRHVGEHRAAGRARTTLRDRSRDLARNNPWASRMLDIMSRTCGRQRHRAGFEHRQRQDRQSSQFALEDLVDQADITGCLIVLCDARPRCPRDGRGRRNVIRFIDTRAARCESVPLKLQLLEGDFIDESREGIFAKAARDDRRRA